MTKEYEHKVDLGEGEVEIDLDKEWKPPEADEELQVEVEEEKKPEPEPTPEPEPEEEAPKPNKIDPEVINLREQIAALNARLAQREQNDFKSSIEREDQELTGKIAAAKAKLKKAQEEGNVDATVDAQDELTNLRVDERARLIQRQQQEAVARQPQPQPQVHGNPLTNQWKAKNDWYGKPEYAAETLTARIIDSEMAQQGYVPNTEDYFEELNKRLKSKFRTVDPVGLKPKKAEKKPEQAPNLAPPRKASTPTRPGVVRLNQEDFTVMRMVGMDPNDKNDRLAYAKQKISYGE